jgi:hypothetical protein
LTQLVYDETLGSNQANPGYLRLDAYDFVCPCEAHPNSYISDREILVPLDYLQTLFMMEMNAIRNPDNISSDDTDSDSERGANIANNLVVDPAVPITREDPRPRKYRKTNDSGRVQAS